MDHNTLISTSNAAMGGAGRVDQKATEDYEASGGGFAPAGEGEISEPSEPQSLPPQERPQEVKVEESTQLGNRQDVDLLDPEPSAVPQPTPDVTPNVDPVQDWEVQRRGLQAALKAERELRQTAQQRIDEITSSWQEDRHFRETYEPHLERVDALAVKLEEEQKQHQSELASARDAEKWRDFYRNQVHDREGLSRLEQDFDRQLKQDRAFERMETLPTEMENRFAQLFDQRINQTEQKDLESRQTEWREARDRQTKIMIGEKLDEIYKVNPSLEQFNDYFTSKLGQDPLRATDDLIAPFLAHASKQEEIVAAEPEVVVGGQTPTTAPAPTEMPDLSGMGIDQQIEFLKRSGQLR